MIRADKASDVLSLAGLSSLRDEELLAYLKRQRWFGLKGTATKARVMDVVRLPWDESRLGVAFIEVETPSGPVTYQLPLSVRRTDAAAIDAAMVVAPIETKEGKGALLDGIHDPNFQKQLGATFLNPCAYDSEKGRKWSIERVGKSSIAFRPDAEITVGSAEQSNSALIFDRPAFLTLFRRIEPGIHPDVEMTRFLTQDAGFPHVPALFGLVTLSDVTLSEAKGRDSHAEPALVVCGMMQEYLAGSRDAWSYILEATKKDPSGTARDVEKLGAITREMHDALAGDAANAAGSAFTPLATAPGDVERWAQKTKETIRDAVSLLEKQRAAGKLATDRAAEAEIITRRRDHYISWVEEIADIIDSDGGSRIRTHGDYHLGQVLRTKSDSFVIIDFEGEPTRPLAERREKTSALRDVAGMLRSLSYAAATMVQAAPNEKPDRKRQAERELIGGRWERDARAAFLRGYTGAMKDDRGLLPNDPKRFDALLSLFEAEKVFYELTYELNHRPGWEWIPLRGISRLLVQRPA